MPPRRFSRYTFCAAALDAGGNLMLSEPEPYAYRALPDTRRHVAQEGDTLFSLAAKFFPNFVRGDGLWWVIADFQPDPIVDPTLRLAPGRVVHVPSERVVTEEIFSEARRAETIG